MKTLLLIKLSTSKMHSILHKTLYEDADLIQL